MSIGGTSRATQTEMTWALMQQRLAFLTTRIEALMKENATLRQQLADGTREADFVGKEGS